MSLNVEGKVYHIGETELVGKNKDFKKRILVVETQEQYPQKVKVEFTQANTYDLDFVQVGEMVNVLFNLRGNEYNGNFYTSLQGWKIQKKELSAPAPAPTPTPDPLAEPAADEVANLNNALDNPPAEKAAPSAPAPEAAKPAAAPTPAPAEKAAPAPAAPTQDIDAGLEEDDLLGGDDLI